MSENVSFDRPTTDLNSSSKTLTCEGCQPLYTQLARVAGDLRVRLSTVVKAVQDSRSGACPVVALENSVVSQQTIHESDYPTVGSFTGESFLIYKIQ